ncbi:MAG: PD-(D/E)XK nuclease domain-containing protein [Lachnospiraceae bacterium]|nr:PD-(D/E)XK nuclease domain-containing protein [Lachnospiraceae bacterium]
MTLVHTPVRFSHYFAHCWCEQQHFCIQIENIMRVLKASERLLEDTLRGDAESVAQALDQAHMEAASILTYNDENSLSCAIGLAYYSARKDYRLIRELPAGRGFADIVFLPSPSVAKPALVVELKYDKSANTAIQQIKDRHYTKALGDYVGEILLVGISYDKNEKDKSYSCVIERLEKTEN